MTHPRVIISASVGRAAALARQHVNDSDVLTHNYASYCHYGRELKQVMRRHDLYQYDAQ